VFTARYALSPYIKQIRFVFKELNNTLKKVGGDCVGAAGGGGGGGVEG
jgi:hypothetical protein